MGGVDKTIHCDHGDDHIERSGNDKIRLYVRTKPCSLGKDPGLQDWNWKNNYLRKGTKEGEAREAKSRHSFESERPSICNTFGIESRTQNMS